MVQRGDHSYPAEMTADQSDWLHERAAERRKQWAEWKMTKFEEIKVGDCVERLLGGPGGAPMKLKVTEVTPIHIICGWWTFDRKTGVEEDEDLGWGVKYGVTGSYLTGVHSDRN